MIIIIIIIIIIIAAYLEGTRCKTTGLSETSYFYSTLNAPVQFCLKCYQRA